jgi:hypothetical protein
MSKPIVAVLALFVYACGSASPTTPVPPPQPSLPSSTHYRLSGVVTDITSGSPVPNAAVTMHLNGVPLRTSRSNGSGEYLIEFDAAATSPGSSGLIFAAPGANSNYWANLQMLSWSSPEMVKNLRLRPSRKIAAGQSMTLAIESDSSLAYDQEWDPWVFPSLNTQWEEFWVLVPTDGILTVAVRSETGGAPPTVNCPYVGCPWPPASGTVSFPVRSESSLYLNIAIPRSDVPQRYEISTSLH